MKRKSSLYSWILYTTKVYMITRSNSCWMLLEVWTFESVITDDDNHLGSNRWLCHDDVETELRRHPHTRINTIFIKEPSICPHETALVHLEIYDSCWGQPHEMRLHYPGTQNVHPVHKTSLLLSIKKHHWCSNSISAMRPYKTLHE
jgi:hypothetical protein